jgi:polygalacturonase
MSRAFTLLAAASLGLGIVSLGCASGNADAPDGGAGSGGQGPVGQGGGPGMGGQPGTGGGAGTGGAPGAGGAPGTGGAAGAGAGGAAGRGGAAGTGGTSGTGGAAGTGAGGTAGRGGAAGSGGAAGTGGAAGSSAADPCGPSNPAVVPLPVIGPGMFNVTTTGAVGDGKTDNTTAIQAALTAAGAAGGGTVVVPSGTFLSGPIVLSSGTRLELAAGAVLTMLPMGSYPGTTAFITANNAHDIAITGAGTIEGQGQAWWNALTATPTLARPQEVSLSNSTRVQISSIRLQNPPEEHIWVKGDTNVTITGITISTLAVAGQHIPNNTDGVDIGANGVFFCNNNIACGDDNVVMSGTNIYVAYSTFGVGHGCSIGSITTKGVSNVTVDHVTMNGTTSGIRMKSARDRGGLVQNLTYSNMTMTNVQNPVYITSYYPTLPTDPTTDPAQAITATTPQWNNITIKNVTITGSTNAGILWGLPEQKISALTFDNVRIQATTGMEVFHATGVSFINGSTVTPKSGAAVTTFDAAVTGIATTPR